MMWLSNSLPGRATPRVPRWQSRCPGVEHRADCSWKEGTSRAHDVYNGRVSFTNPRAPNLR